MPSTLRAVIPACLMLLLLHPAGLLRAADETGGQPGADAGASGGRATQGDPPESEHPLPPPDDADGEPAQPDPQGAPENAATAVDPAAADDGERPGTPGSGGTSPGGPGDPFRVGGPAQTIGQIVVDGNVRVSDSAFYNSLRIKPGEAFDEKAIADEFRRLWSLNLFEDIVVESRQREDNVVDLIFHVRDRPLVSNVAFVGMKAVTESNIHERLGQAKAEVRRGQPVDFSLLRKAEGAIGQLLAEKGYLQAQVHARLTPVHQGQREVTFHITEGGKTKIKKIDFIGNTVFKDRELKKMLKMTKEAFWLTSWASSKPLYHPAKLDQDAEGIRTAYKSSGYLKVLLKPEVVESEAEYEYRRKLDRAEKTGSPPPPDEPMEEEADIIWEEPEPAPPPPDETEKARKKRVKAELKAKKEAKKVPKRWVYLTIPLEEGDQFRVGTIEIEGNRVFSDPEVLARLPLRKGMIFNDSALKFGVKRLEDDYGERGYFYVSIDPQVTKKDKVADLRLEVTEDKKYSVDRIEFSGNTTTRDKVLRREMRLMEEELFNVRLLRLGTRKIGQLGYWQVGQDPVVKPLPNEAKVDIEVQGIEANRNEIQVGGGVSGLEGGFFQGSYSTRNFLGRGEILSTFIQTGSRTNRYSINFTEPWFLGKPWTLGFSIFQRQTKFVDFTQDSTGGNIFVGRLLGNFSRFDLGYSLQDVTVDGDPGSGVRNASAVTSSVSTVYTFDTRNNFFRPTRGVRLQSVLEYAGGLFGGDNEFVKPRVDATLFLPGLRRRHYIGLNASYGYVRALGDTDVPVYERFYLGGERSLRIFGTRTVGPVRRDKDLNSDGRINFPEDRVPNGVFDACEDLNGNGVQDPNETDWGNCRLDAAEDLNGDFILDTEDLNRNGVLDPGEDANGNGILDSEDVNGNGVLDPGEDLNGNGALDPGEDTNGDGVFGTVFPGGNQYLQLNAEYAMPLSDTVEFVLFYDAGNAFDDDEGLSLSNMRVDYGFEMRFFLPVFQAPLRLIYGYLQNPRPGEDASNFIFSIGTTF